MFNYLSHKGSDKPMSKTNLSVNIELGATQKSLTGLKRQIKDFLGNTIFSITPSFKVTKTSINSVIKEANEYIKKENPITFPINFKYSNKQLKEFTSNIEKDLKAENSLGVALELQLDTKKSKDNIRKQIENVINEVTNDISAKITYTKKESVFQKNTLQNKIEGFNSSDPETSLNDLKKEIDDLNQPTDEINRKFKELQEILHRIQTINSMEKQGDYIDDYTRKLKNLNRAIRDQSVKEVINTSNSQPIVDTFFEELNENGGSKERLEILRERINNLAIPANKVRNTIVELSNELNRLTSEQGSQNIEAQANAIEKWNNKIEKLEVSVDGLSKQNEEQIERNRHKIEQLSNTIQSFDNKYQTLINKNKVSTSNFHTRLNALSQTDTSGIKELSNDWKEYTSELKSSGMLTETTFQILKKNISKFLQWYGTSNLTTKVIHFGKNLFSEVKSIDTAMTNLKKVTDATDSSFDNFLTNAYSNAKKLGVAVTDLIDATSEFSRLGYSLDESTILGQAAVLYKNVGDGVTATEASESIISTMKAFGIEAEDVETEIVDKFNEIGNNFAISSTGIGDALQKSAASLNAANNSLDESIALITAANAIAQDPDSVGSAMKVVAARIRGAKSELEEMGEDTDDLAESTSKLRSELKALTGVDIMLADGETFKSTYQILDEISSIWDNLSDVSQASVLETLAGKNRSSVVAGLISNFEEAREVIEACETSAGSAAEEQARYLESIEGRLATLKATFQEISNTTINSNWFKIGITGATTILNIVAELVDLLGGIPVILATIGVGRLTCPFICSHNLYIECNTP